MAGGASHADVMGQVVTRSAAWLTLVIAILCGLKPDIIKTGAAAWLLLAALLLVLLQLVPLPPAVWTLLPGRGPFLESALGAPPWRPWAIVPWATMNAAFSLIVPVVTFYLLSVLADDCGDQHREYPRWRAAKRVPDVAPAEHQPHPDGQKARQDAGS